MLIANKYEVPNYCPKDCTFLGSLNEFQFCSLCNKCPICTCNDSDLAMSLSDFREDWAEEWHDFFKGKNDYPYLPQIPSKDLNE